MHKKTLLFLAITAMLTVPSCSKDKDRDGDCQQLQNAIATDNKDEVRDAINSLINELSSQNYTSENLNKLVALINQQCAVSASTLCFDCIDTLPSQSEIRISFFTVNGRLEKTIDISYTGAGRMIFNNIHN